MSDSEDGSAMSAMSEEAQYWSQGDISDDDCNAAPTPASPPHEGHVQELALVREEPGEAHVPSEEERREEPESQAEEEDAAAPEEGEEEAAAAAAAKGASDEDVEWDPTMTLANQARLGWFGVHTTTRGEFAKHTRRLSPKHPMSKEGSGATSC